jgi:hypothetical protein
VIGTSNSSSSNDKVYFLKPKNGSFNVYAPNDPDAELTTQSVSGIFEGMDIQQDPGNNKPGTIPIEPYKALRVFISDSSGEVPERYILRAKMDISFTKSLAEQLAHIAKGDPIQISVKNGDQRPTVTLVSVRRLIEGEYKYTPTRIDPEKDYLAFVAEHPAFIVRTEAAAS